MAMQISDSICGGNVGLAYNIPQILNKSIGHLFSDCLSTKQIKNLMPSQLWGSFQGEAQLSKSQSSKYDALLMSHTFEEEKKKRSWMIWEGKN